MQLIDKPNLLVLDSQDKEHLRCRNTQIQEQLRAIKASLKLLTLSSQLSPQLILTIKRYFLISVMLCHQPRMTDSYKKKVWSCSAYLQRGSDKTLTKINDAIPHTRIDMGYHRGIRIPYRIVYARMSAVRCPLVKMKLSDFFVRTVRKHFQHVLSHGLLRKTWQRYESFLQTALKLWCIAPKY